MAPEGDEFQYALTFGFKSSNNMAEYQAIIAGMNLALKMRIEELAIHVDSQLVIKQIQGEYEVKEPSLLPH